MQFTKTERLLLYNQYRILEKLYPDEAKCYANASEIVAVGYTWLYDQELTQVIQDELSPDKCREVTDILDMYRALHNASGASFPGFDGNEEPEYLKYATFMIENMERWKEFNTHNLNSHSPMLPTYRRMLQAWEASPKKLELAQDDVARIKEAGNNS